MNPPYSINTRDVRRRFDKAASSFDDADFVHAVAREGLFSRLEPVTVDTSLVVDLGCGTGAATRDLAKRFKGAQVVGVDLSANMLQRYRSRRGWFSKARVVQADARRLPFADQGVDVVFSNLLLPWIDEPSTLAQEVARVLRKDGLFGFSTLGPDTLAGLREAWRNVDGFEHVNRFVDMHDIGDALVRAGLRDPVLDVDRLTVSYTSSDALLRDLTACGARNSLAGRPPGLTGRGSFGAMRGRLEAGAEPLSLNLELVFGHCWGGVPKAADGGVRVAADSIPVRDRKSL